MKIKIKVSLRSPRLPLTSTARTHNEFMVMSEQSTSSGLSSVALLAKEGSPQPPTGHSPSAVSPPERPEITSIRLSLALLNYLDLRCPSKPPSVISVLRLYCIHGMTIPEIARRFRCSVGTVCNRLKLFRKTTGHSPELIRGSEHPHRGRPKNQI